MYNPQKPFRFSSAILLIGICACLPEEHGDPIDEQLDEVDVSDPADITTIELGEQSSEINSNEAGTAEASADSLQADFNGDGYADLAIGAPSANANDNATTVASGSVNVIYGSDSGLDAGAMTAALPDQILFRPANSSADTAEVDDAFGWAIAAGDFNDDGIADLAIGVPFDKIGVGVNADAKAGSVEIRYGASNGLSVMPQIITQDTTGLEDAEPNDNFGYALTVGDFDDDGIDDLAIGVPGENVGGDAKAGLVHVIFGSLGGGMVPGGLVPGDDQIWSQDTAGVDGVAEVGDGFGSALAAGDFDDDGASDLAIGVPLENTGSLSDAGWVNVLYGSQTGLTEAGDDIWHQDSSGIQGTGESDDEFGSALAVGDFDNDGYDDLAVGVPSEDVGSPDDAGAVNVIYGAGSGLTTSGDQYLHQNTTGIDGSVEAGDEFGAALAAGDFDDDGHDDLAIGAPYDSVSNVDEVGVVNVLYGINTGLSTSGDQLWHQNSTTGMNEIDGVAEAGEHFGFALSMGDFDHDGAADLAIGVPSDTIPKGMATVTDAGAVNVIYGSDSGLTSVTDQYWHQEVADVEGVAATGDEFGHSVR